MKRSALRRLLALVVLAAAVFALSAAPAGASQYPYQYPYQYPNQNPYQYPYQYPYGNTGRGRFKDILDEKVSQAADVLYDLGVVNGTSPGLFTPEGRLTRAEMCKIAVEVLGLGDKVQGQMYRTIFTDVGGSHWARGYVNLAATTEITEGSRLMLGLGNGTFGPELEVTYQETVTLVLRILGYGAEANQSWPYGAIETASQLGLDRALIKSSAPRSPLRRAESGGCGG
ncbi:MAG: S-layer homology domain-containing protein, partial [Oscillospiraceae bacterium]|nr:S-layer homology domain-containing protein [Oscillospiraceae bacterium]